jgi:hypothetical protein
VTSHSYEEEFRPLAERYRKRMRLFVALFLCAVPLIAAVAFGSGELGDLLRRSGNYLCPGGAYYFLYRLAIIVPGVRQIS